MIVATEARDHLHACAVEGARCGKDSAEHACIEHVPDEYALTHRFDAMR